MVHYRFWGNRYDCPTFDDFPTLKFSLQCIHSLDIPPVNYPEGFQGDAIPIDGTLAPRTCYERPILVDEADDWLCGIVHKHP